MRFVRVRGDPPTSLDSEGLRDAVDRVEVAIAVVYGSHARGEAGELSDLDVAVRFSQGIGGAQKRRILDELTVSIEERTGHEAVDLVDLDVVGPELGYEALSQGVLVYGDQDAALDLEAEFMLRALDLEPLKRRWRDAFDDRIREGTFGRP